MAAFSAFLQRVESSAVTVLEAETKVRKVSFPTGKFDIALKAPDDQSSASAVMPPYSSLGPSAELHAGIKPVQHMEMHFPHGHGCKEQFGQNTTDVTRLRRGRRRG